MNSIEIFQLALNLQRPWYVKDVTFKELKTRGDKELHIEIGCEKGHDFGGGSKVHDRIEREWRHLNFFEHTCYLRCRVPRVKDPGKGTVRMVDVPWARKDSGFTLLFEAISMAL